MGGCLVSFVGKIEEARGAEDPGLYVLVDLPLGALRGCSEGVW